MSPCSKCETIGPTRLKSNGFLKHVLFINQFKNSIILLESCMQYQSSPFYPLFGSMGKTCHSLQITINPTSLNGILLSNTQKNPKQSNARKNLSHGTILIIVSIPLCQTNNNLLSNCTFNILTTCPIIHFHSLHIFELGINQNTKFSLHQQDLAFMYCQMGKYLPQYLIIILSINVLCFTFQNCSHRSL
jgi:hypothetical protein